MCLATAAVQGRYQPRYRRSTVVDAWGVTLRIDQAAFWALQALGWQDPYELRYRWSC